MYSYQLAEIVVGPLTYPGRFSWASPIAWDSWHSDKLLFKSNGGAMERRNGLNCNGGTNHQCNGSYLVRSTF